MSEAETNYIIEFTTIGAVVKVTAIDPVSLREVSIIGDVKATREHLSTLAVRKLHYVLAKTQNS